MVRKRFVLGRLFGGSFHDDFGSRRQVIATVLRVRRGVFQMSAKVEGRDPLGHLVPFSALFRGRE